MSNDCLAVVSGPCAPIPGPGYSAGTAPSASSNNVSVPAVQSQDVTAILTVPLNAFTVVKVVSGGIAPVSTTVPGDKDQIFGLTLQAGTTGQGVLVRPLGAVVNPLTGTLAWNWALGDDIYVNVDGTLINLPPASGWSLIVGHAFAPAGILFKPDPVLPTGPTFIDINALTYTVPNGEDEVIVLAAATSGNQTISLPANPTSNRRVAVKRMDAIGANTLTIDGNGHNIDGAATAALAAQYEVLRLVYDTANAAWFAI